MLGRHTLSGRRAGGRRRDARSNVYVDRYTRTEWGLALALVLLSLVDLVLTTVYLQLGGEEANPLMARALQGGYRTFAATKMGMTGVGALFLLLHVRFRIARTMLVVIVALYVVLILFHAVTWIPQVLSSS